MDIVDYVLVTLEQTFTILLAFVVAPNFFLNNFFFPDWTQTKPYILYISKMYTGFASCAFFIRACKHFLC